MVFNQLNLLQKAKKILISMPTSRYSVVKCFCHKIFLESLCVYLLILLAAEPKFASIKVPQNKNDSSYKKLNINFICFFCFFSLSYTMIRHHKSNTF